MAKSTGKSQDRLKRRLEVKDFKLMSLKTIAEAINSNQKVEDLLQTYKQTLMEPPLSIEKLLLFEKQRSWENIMQFGVEATFPMLEEGDLVKVESSKFLRTNEGVKETFEVSLPVKHDDQVIAYVMVGDIKDEGGVSPIIKHLNFIETLTNIIIVAIKNRRFVEDSLRQERVRKELELAAEMQAMLIPNELPSNEFFDVSAIYRPHAQVGGDYYDFIPINEKEVMLCMADVSGKGVSAAFLMSNFQAYLMAIFRFQNMALNDIVHELNERVVKSTQGEKFITFFFGVYNKETRMLKYINCAQNPPLFMNSQGKVVWLDKGCVGLGMLDEIPVVESGEVKVDEGSVVICYTDGLTEVENEDLEQYGSHRLSEAVKNNFHAPTAALNQLIIKELNSFRGTMPFVDDTALLSCRFH